MGLARRWFVAVAAVSTTALGILAYDSGAQAALGSSDQVAAAEEICRIEVARSDETAEQLFPLQRTQAQGRTSRKHSRKKGKKRHTHGRRSAASHGELQVVLADTSGPYTLVFLTDGSTDSDCLMGPESPRPSSIGGDSPSALTVNVPANQIGALSFGFSRAHDEKPFMYAAGRVGSGVTAIRFVLESGKHVSAAIAEGWFLAFWPDLQPVVAAEVVTAGGTSTQRLRDPVLGK
jgi:hypothetical protein